MKEDILEQLVDDYLQAQGYFTRHNIKFKPASDHAEYRSKDDNNYSDVDVVGINPRLSGSERVWVASCKSWQIGFQIPQILKALENDQNYAGKKAWKCFRELMVPKWTEALFAAVEKITGSRTFTYVTAATFTKGDKQTWETNPRFLEALDGNPIKLLTLQEILTDLDADKTTTVATSAIGRTLQLMRAARKGAPALEEEVQSSPINSAD